MDQSEIKVDDYTTQLLRLRALTGTLGALHEGQAMQLRLWPFTIDPELIKAEAHVDIENRKIVYIWKANHKKNFKPDKQYRFRLQELAKSIHLMLGETWTFTIKLNGTRIFPMGVNGKSTRRKKSTSSRKR
jgi:hypothetical protein